MSNYKISIIIPIYNAENTLNRCLNSVINQSIGFKNIELILVDDMSTDNTKEVIKYYSDKYDNIKTIYLRENNGNPGFVRSIGINNATAPYLMFIDADDSFDKNICKILYENILNNDVGLVQCNHKIILEDGNIINPSHMDMFPDFPVDLDNFPDVYTQGYIWNKIFRTNIVKKMGNLYINYIPEDYIFVLEYLFASNSNILFLKNYYGYNYYIYESSFSKNPAKNLISNCETLSLTSNLLDEYKPNSYKIHIKVYNLLLTIILTNLMRIKSIDKNQFNQIIDLIYDIENELPFKVNISIKILNVLNNLILKRRYKLIRIYFKLLYLVSSSKNIKKIYRRIIN